MTTKNLQNGSDIRGIALPGVDGETPNLGRTETIALTYGYIYWLSRKLGKKVEELRIAIGMDPRLSGPNLKQWAIESLTAHKIMVFDCGLATTPAMFMSTVFPEFYTDGAIMITASHLPFNRNGFKYFDKNGGLDKSDISNIIEIADKYTLCQNKPCSYDNHIHKANLMDLYAKHLRKLITTGLNQSEGSKVLNNMKITVDAGNGGGGFFATQVLEPLGADISGSQFLNPDGKFPNHAPNPEDKTAMLSICSAVKNTNSDFGLIFDTDVDRSAAVDTYGNPISRNEIVALAASLVADKNPGSTIVTDSVTSNHVNNFIEKSLGLKHLRFKRGYKNVINKSIELNKKNILSPLAIETSGHAAFKDNYFLDDGAYLAAQIVIKSTQLKAQGKSLDSLLSQLQKPAQTKEVRMKINDNNFSNYGDIILDLLEKWVKNENGLLLIEPNYEGVRIDFDALNGNGWALLRKSLHDPIMPLNIESDDNDGCSKIALHLKTFLMQFENLDISEL